MLWLETVKSNIITCQLLVRSDYKYACRLSNVNITDEYASLTIETDHEQGRTDLNVTILDLSGGHVSFLPNFFQKFPNIQEMSVFESKLMRINENSFKGAFNLEFLSINGNYLQALEPRIFQNCNKLNTLNLNFNNISKIDRDAFFGLENNVMTLNLERNYCIDEMFSINTKKDWSLIWGKLRMCVLDEKN